MWSPANLCYTLSLRFVNKPHDHSFILLYCLSSQRNLLILMCGGLQEPVNPNEENIQNRYILSAESFAVCDLRKSNCQPFKNTKFSSQQFQNLNVFPR
jgi:hypothetical protein